MKLELAEITATDITEAYPEKLNQPTGIDDMGFFHTILRRGRTYYYTEVTFTLDDDNYPVLEVVHYYNDIMGKYTSFSDDDIDGIRHELSEKIYNGGLY